MVANGRLVDDLVLWAPRHATQVVYVVVFVVLCATWKQVGVPSRVSVPATAATAVWDNSSDAVVVAVQIADLHLRDLSSPSVKNYQEFLYGVAPLVRPSMVIVAGDLPDSVTGLWPLQHESQWQLYRSVWANASASSTVGSWVEVMGNHDIYGAEDPARFPSQYAVGGKEVMRRVRVVNLTAPSGKYYVPFVLASTVLEKNWWCSWVGKATPGQVEEIRDELRRYARSGVPAVLVAHHSLNFVAVDNMLSDLSTRLFQDRSAPLSYHLAGHWHRSLYTRHRSGTVELVADALKNGGYRVLAFDNGVLSFTDARLGTWPVAVLTTPKSARFLAHNEPLQLMAAANCIRCLAFSPVGISSVTARVDRADACTLTRQANSSLFSCSWSFDRVRTGLHSITVTIRDNRGQESVIDDVFSLDGSVRSLSGFGAFYLRFPVHTDASQSPRTLLWAWTSLEVLLLLLVILPRPVAFLFSKWNEWQGSRGLKKSFGPISASWVTAVEEGKTSWTEFRQTNTMAWHHKVVTTATWQLQATISVHAQIPRLLWLVLLLLTVLHAAAPGLITAYGSSRGALVSWPWGSLAGGTFTLDEIVTILSVLYLLCVLYPTLSLVSGWHLKSRAGRLSLRPSLGEGLLAGLLLVAIPCLIVLIGLCQRPMAILLSPMTYSILACCAVAVHTLASHARRIRTQNVAPVFSYTIPRSAATEYSNLI